MNSAEHNYTVSMNEALTVVCFHKKMFRHYLLSIEAFTLTTDHKALRSAFEKKTCTAGWSGGLTSSLTTRSMSFTVAILQIYPQIIYLSIPTITRL